MDKQALFNISYGLYVLSSSYEGKNTGCIINTVNQVADNALKLAIAVSKKNYTESIIQKAKMFNLSILSESAPFSIFQNFGFQSGRDIDKFKHISYLKDINNMPYLSRYVNTTVSCEIDTTINLSSHTLFLANIVDAKILSDEKSMTYSYYHKYVKPKPQTKNKGWVCKICGYVYEGEELPKDFVCPICKHGATDFEKIPN